MSEIAWAAGLFEGEGCFSSVGRPGIHGRQSARASLSMRDASTVTRFKEAVGIGTVYIDGNKRASGRHLTVWSTTDADGFRRVVGMLWPWLSPRRQARATELLRALDLPKGKPWEGTPKSARKHLTKDEIRRIRRSTSPYKTLSERFGVTYGTIARVKQSDPARVTCSTS